MSGMVRRLIVKDWQVYQKQLSAYLAGMAVALALVATGHDLARAAGALLLLVLLLVVGSYAIQTSVMSERKQQTGPFIMSLPVTPMDVYWGKLLANLLIYLVPFAVVTGGMIALILTSSLPDGLVPWVAVIGPFIYWVGTMEGIASHMRGDAVVWSGAALGLLGGQAAVIFVVVILTSWVHARKRAFL